jgi:hypothetical protein
VAWKSTRWPLLMDAVRAGLGATIQPWAAVGALPPTPRAQCARLADAAARRRNLLCSLSDDELSPAALAARVVLADCARTLVSEGPVGATARPGRHPSRILKTPLRGAACGAAGAYSAAMRRMRSGAPESK